ncbi:MAG: JAB domain-containing protein [Bacteroidales bacterium]
MKTYKSPLPELSLKYKKGDFKKIRITNSKEASQVIREFFDADLIEYREEMFVLFTNRKNNTIGYMKISVGGTSGTVTDPKMIFSTALLSGAYGIILAHNHPSGETFPSKPDRAITKKIMKGAELMDMVLLDHIIITADSYYSFADEGTLNERAINTL